MLDKDPGIDGAGVSTGKGGVVSALFGSISAARAAVRDLRTAGVPEDNISIISRDEDRGQDIELSGAAGVAREEIQDEGLSYRASHELPEDEDLPSSYAYQADDMLVVTSHEVPPNEPLGGSDRLGLSRDADMVRRNEADTNADRDIYTDFPDEPGGINPDSPAAARGGTDMHEDMKDRTPVTSSAAVGAGIGAVGGLLAGLAALAIPGVGPVLAAGPLAAALGGALAGGTAGGVIGGLSAIGVPEEYAREYAAGIEQGQTLVSVQPGSVLRGEIERILGEQGGSTIH